MKFSHYIQYLGTIAPEKMVQAYNAIKAISAWIKYVGIPDAINRYCVAQCMLESNYGASNVAQTDNNYSGIKWINKPYQKATRGLKSPDGGYYAHFANVGDWAADYKRILSIKGSQGAPINATTANQFGQALKANGYATDPNYYLKFNSTLRDVDNAVNLYQPQYGTAPIQYQGTQGNPNKPVPLITPGTETVTYSNDPNRQPFFNLSNLFNNSSTPGTDKAWYEEHPILAIGIGLAALLTFKKIIE